MNNKKGRLFKRILVGVGILMLVTIVGFLIYSLDFYRATEADITSALESFDGEVIIEGNMTSLIPMDSGSKGFIFYPGGKVEASAYLPLLSKIAEQGITTVLIKMPLNLAVFNVNAANQVYEQYPDVEEWYIGGHSLGGAMASSYIEKHEDAIAGLIQLAAYPLNDSEINTLVIYGSEDQVLDQSLVSDLDQVVVIEGGNHAYFGNYGEQEGDGEAAISREEQQRLTVETIINFMK